MRIGVELRIGDRDAQMVAERREILEGQRLHLVGGVAALETGPQPVPLDGLRQDHGGSAGVLDGRPIGRIHLAGVVGASPERPEIVVGESADQVLRHRGAAEEVVPQEPAGFAAERLVVAVERLVHDADQLAGLILRQQRIPAPAPEHLDDVPSGAAEEALELLHDLAVAAHGPVEPLEVAVDHEGEVVQLFVRRVVEEPAALRLVHLAVPEERPHPLLGGVLDPAAVEVSVELRLIDRVHRAEAHRDRGELPEVGEAARMRVGGEPVTGHRLLLPEAVEVRLAQPPLEEGAGVVPGRGVALPEHLVPAAGMIRSPEEVVQSHLVERRDARVGGDVSAHAHAGALGPMHHDGGVPPDDRPVLPLELLIPRVCGLELCGDGVDVVGGPGGRCGDAVQAGALDQIGEDALGRDRSARTDEPVQRGRPLVVLLEVRSLIRVVLRRVP
ncbi:Alkyl hydroperoxide reductase subunit C-like protein [Brachybacterium faecium]|nr:Alkyl hydroperoxide reductase subunit C-like protein [Brachybacterium faecium]